MNDSKYNRNRSLRDDEWEKLEPLLLGGVGHSGRHGRGNKLFIEAVLWYISGDHVWSDLPPEFGKWNTIYIRLKRWYESGHWQQIAEDLRDDHNMCGFVKEIIAHCDRQQLIRKKRADKRKTLEGTTISVCPRIGKIASDSLTENSTSHWLSLVDVNQIS